MEANAKEHLYRLVDQIPEGEVHAARRYLEYLAEHGDPFVSSLMEAPEEDEELSEEGQRLLDEGDEDLRAGRTHTLEEVKQGSESELDCQLLQKGAPRSPTAR